MGWQLRISDAGRGAGLEWGTGTAPPHGSADEGGSGEPSKLMSELQDKCRAVSRGNAPTHLLVLGQALLGLGELVALRLLGHGVVVVGSHGG